MVLEDRLILIAKLNAQTRITSTCWFFMGPLNKQGYGQIRVLINNKPARIKAHRLSYYIKNEAFIFDKKTLISQTCRNRHCINPDHLFEISKKEAGLLGARYRTHCPKEHEYTPVNTRIRKKDNRTYKMCRQCEKDRYQRKKFAYLSKLGYSSDQCLKDGQATAVVSAAREICNVAKLSIQREVLNEQLRLNSTKALD